MKGRKGDRGRRRTEAWEKGKKGRRQRRALAKEVKTQEMAKAVQNCTVINALSDAIAQIALLITRREALPRHQGAGTISGKHARLYRLAGMNYAAKLSIPPILQHKMTMTSPKKADRLTHNQPANRVR